MGRAHSVLLVKRQALIRPNVLTALKGQLVSVATVVDAKMDRAQLTTGSPAWSVQHLRLALVAHVVRRVDQELSQILAEHRAWPAALENIVQMVPAALFVQLVFSRTKRMQNV